MKILKSRIFLVIVTAIIFTTVGVMAANLNASDISYGNGTVASAIDDLYTKSNNYNCVGGTFTCTDCITANGQQINNINFTPSIVYLHANDTDNKELIWYYNGGQNMTWWSNVDGGMYGTSVASNNFDINNKLLLKNFNSSWENVTFDYVVCR